MKPSTRLRVSGSIGRWVAIAGAALATVGLGVLALDGSTQIASALAMAGALAICFGAGIHLVAGDDTPIPPEVAKVLDALERKDKS